MMKVKELPEDTNLLLLKLKLPEETLKEFRDYCGGEEEMYFAGPMMGDVFMSPQPPSGEGERRLYPFPPMIDVMELMEWEVVENKT